MGGPEFNEIAPIVPPATEGETPAVPNAAETLAPQSVNWMFVDGGRAWGPRPRLTPDEAAREDQDQARLIESIDLHRN